MKVSLLRLKRSSLSVLTGTGLIAWVASLAQAQVPYIPPPPPVYTPPPVFTPPPQINIPQQNYASQQAIQAYQSSQQAMNHANQVRYQTQQASEIERQTREFRRSTNGVAAGPAAANPPQWNGNPQGNSSWPANRGRANEVLSALRQLQERGQLGLTPAEREFARRGRQAIQSAWGLP